MPYVEIIVIPSILNRWHYKFDSLRSHLEISNVRSAKAWFYASWNLASIPWIGFSGYLAGLCSNKWKCVCSGFGTEFELWPSSLLTVWPWADDYTSLNLRYPTFKTEIIVIIIIIIIIPNSVDDCEAHKITQHFPYIHLSLLDNLVLSSDKRKQKNNSLGKCMLNPYKGKAILSIFCSY